MKHTRFSPASYDAWFKHSKGLWNLYCASAETIMHRTNMMQDHPADHPEFSRMVTEKQQALAEGMIAFGTQWQKQAMQWMIRPTLEPSADYLLNNQLKLYNAFMGSAGKKATANAKRLRKKKV